MYSVEYSSEFHKPQENRMSQSSLVALLGTLLVSTILFGPISEAKAARLYTNTNPLFEACIQRCEEQTPLGALTKRGCYKGCAEIRRVADIPESYRSMASCIEDMNELELVKDLVIEKHQAWCDRQTPHIHKRKGCRDAMEVYMRAATVNSICYNQQPKVIAKQTPRTSLTTRYPAVTSRPPSQPIPSSSGAYSATPIPSYDIPLQGNVLSMPPVYDTPKYRRQPATAQKNKQPAKRAKPVATSPNTTSKAPSLAPPKSAASATPKKVIMPQASKTVPVITPSTATIGSATHPANASGSTPATSTTKTTGQVSGQASGQGSGQAQASSSPQGGAPAKDAGAPSSTAATPTVTPPPAPEPVINAATPPTAPPIIAPPTAVLPVFSTVAPPPKATMTQAPSPAHNAGLAGQGPDLLPRLQPSENQGPSQRMGQSMGQSTDNNSPVDNNPTHGIDTPMPQPIPAPAV